MTLTPGPKAGIANGHRRRGAGDGNAGVLPGLAAASGCRDVRQGQRDPRHRDERRHRVTPS